MHLVLSSNDVGKKLQVYKVHQNTSKAEEWSWSAVSFPQIIEVKE